MTLPRKRKPQKSGIERAPRREWPRHRRFVKSHQCCLAGYIVYNPSDTCDGPIEFAHLRLGTHTGMKQTPHDRYGISLCRKHHAEAHKGEATFQRKYRFDWMAKAAEFVRFSPDRAMKDSLRETTNAD